MVKIYIEVAIIIIIILILLFWSIWFRWSKKRERKKYNPNDDLGRRAEESRRKELEGEKRREEKRGNNTRTITESSKQDDSIGRSTPITEQGLFPATTSPKPRDNNLGGGKNSKGLRGFFGKFKRRNKE